MEVRSVPKHHRLNNLICGVKKRKCHIITNISDNNELVKFKGEKSEKSNGKELKTGLKTYASVKIKKKC